MNVERWDACGYGEYQYNTTQYNGCIHYIFATLFELLSVDDSLSLHFFRELVEIITVLDEDDYHRFIFFVEQLQTTESLTKAIEIFRSQGLVITDEVFAGLIDMIRLCDFYRSYFNLKIEMEDIRTYFRQYMTEDEIDEAMERPYFKQVVEDLVSDREYTDKNEYS